ncbi:hypothetical protein TGCAST_362880 [Toxoplasma gondii CAST]|uniref:Uncharacterized protein n=1 Tax=Toxoplasma gondii CAST TaxID=943122 RepID=A0A3R7Z1Q6_TOXGO|nr:hypothetical protein TGCAST_362880 [Toxoplasma gondii CAST]
MCERSQKVTGCLYTAPIRSARRSGTRSFLDLSRFGVRVNTSSSRSTILFAWVLFSLFQKRGGKVWMEKKRLGFAGRFPRGSRVQCRRLPGGKAAATLLTSDQRSARRQGKKHGEKEHQEQTAGVPSSTRHRIEPQTRLGACEVHWSVDSPRQHGHALRHPISRTYVSLQRVAIQTLDAFFGGAACRSQEKGRLCQLGNIESGDKTE